MSMTVVFPYVDPADAPIEGQPINVSWNTELNKARNGYEQRRQLWTQGQHDFTLRWKDVENALTKLDVLYTFYVGRQGRTLPFLYFDFETGHAWAALAVGTGTGSQTTWDLPCRNGSAFTVKVGGVTKTPVTDYNITALAGTLGRDQIVFVAGHEPANGAAITAAFTGQRAFPVRFDADKLTFSTFSALLFDIGLTLTEVKGE